MTSLDLHIDDRRGDFALQLQASWPLEGVTALFGPSGSGKTSVLDCIAGLRRSMNATVRWGQQCWQGDGKEWPPWQRPVSYVFQEPRLFPHLSVEGNLAFAESRAAHGTFEREQVISWLSLHELRQRRPQALSSGQQQRVAIARALLAGPELLLLDEPLANLDRAAAADILLRLRHISRAASLPMLYVSHQLEEVCTIADRLVLLENGRITDEGPLLELAGRLDTRLAEGDDAAAILTVDVGERDERYHLRELCVGGQSLWVADAAKAATDDSSDSETGDNTAMAGTNGRRRLRVPARDVSLCRERPSHSSILNVLETELESMRDLSPAHCLARLRLGDQYLLARITARSRDELGLSVGDRLFAQIKSTALLSDGDDR